MNSMIGVSSIDDTFNALRRESFKVVLDKISINRINYWKSDPEQAKRTIIQEIATGKNKPSSTWPEYAGGWSFEEFEQECIKRYNEYIR